MPWETIKVCGICCMQRQLFMRFWTHSYLHPSTGLEKQARNESTCVSVCPMQPQFSATQSTFAEFTSHSNSHAACWLCRHFSKKKSQEGASSQYTKIATTHFTCHRQLFKEIERTRDAKLIERGITVRTTDVISAISWSIRNNGYKDTITAIS